MERAKRSSSLPLWKWWRDGGFLGVGEREHVLARAWACVRRLTTAFLFIPYPTFTSAVIPRRDELDVDRRGGRGASTAVRCWVLNRGAMKRLMKLPPSRGYIQIAPF
jgi:hypothetical protein